MKVNFFLPGIGFKIIGGYKVVYQYANYLNKEGYDVNIYYDANNGKNNKKIPPQIMILIRKMMIYFYPYYWIKLSKKIKQIVVKEFCDENIRNADISIATAYTTSKSVYDLSINKGEKIYFIQDFEKWGDVTETMLIDSYKLNMNKIVVSNWLKNIIEKYSKENVTLISNGIEIDNIFKCTNDIKKRYNYSIISLYHDDPRKGCNNLIEVIKKLKIKYPNLKVQFFGYPKRKKEIPKWVKYTKNAKEKTVVKLMNKNAIYVCSSLQEGYGLPGLEAMACGCALVTTNCKGIIEYADESNSLLSDPGDENKLYENICSLLEDNNKRISIAEKGNKDVQRKNINLNYKAFEKYLLDLNNNK